jgi:hypothetical protein
MHTETPEGVGDMRLEKLAIHMGALHKVAFEQALEMVAVDKAHFGLHYYKGDVLEAGIVGLGDSCIHYTGDNSLDSLLAVDYMGRTMYSGVYKQEDRETGSAVSRREGIQQASAIDSGCLGRLLDLKGTACSLEVVERAGCSRDSVCEP